MTIANLLWLVFLAYLVGISVEIFARLRKRKDREDFWNQYYDEDGK